MGNNFHFTYQVETRKVLWLIGLVLLSVLIVQYFELPYRDSMLSLLSSHASEGGGRDTGYKGEQSYLNNTSSPSRPTIEDGRMSAENFVSENTMEIERSIRLRPEMAPANVPYKFSEENAIADDISPSSESITKNKIAASSTILAFPPSLDKSTDMQYKSADISPSVGFIESVPTLRSGENARIAPSPASMDVLLAPAASPTQSITPRNMVIDLGAHAVAFSPLAIPKENGTTSKSNSEIFKSNHIAPSDEHSSTTNNPPPKQMPESQVASVVLISEMNNMLLQSRISPFSKSPLWPSAADQELLDARSQIEHAPILRDHPGLYAPIYRNLSTFVRSYEVMEQKLKIYIYKDGKRPVFHQPRLKGIYASEGWFMKLLKESNQFLTSNPGEAHLFYLPFSSQLLVDYVYVPDSHTFHDIHEYLRNYIGTIKARYPFWNRTDGMDHFLVACHDWAPIETRRLMANCIRALCNSDVKEGFQFGKDISLPETYIHSPQNPMKDIGGIPPSKRKILAFFAGQMHGYVRPILLKHWENKDPDMKIFGRMKKGGNYVWHMKNSKYCICAKGYEVNSPRVVEAILYECVPVIISDNFVPPFFDVLNWDSFAVFVLEKDIPDLKNILVTISDRRYRVMQQRVKQVRQHFLWHNVPVKYDIFHMILHSIWYNRVLRLPP